MKQQTGKVMYKQFVGEIQIWLLTADAKKLSFERFGVQRVLSKYRQRKQACLRQVTVFVLLRVSWLQMVANISILTGIHSFCLLPGSFQEE